MTEGTVLILGKIGINFGAGMTGGTAYIYDPEGEVDIKINKSYVKTEALEEEDIEEINKFQLKHVAYTESKIAKYILDNFKEEINNFVKIVALESKKPALDTDEAVVGK